MCALVRAATPQPREDLLRAYLPVCRSASSTRGVALKHITRHVLGLFHGAARWPRLPAGAERGRAEARGRTRCSRRRWPYTRIPSAKPPHDHSRPRSLHSRSPARCAGDFGRGLRQGGVPGRARTASPWPSSRRATTATWTCRRRVRCRARAWRSIATCSARCRTTLPTVCFPGDPDTPDALFPNNVFATAPGRLVIGHMRHPVRQREAERDDIRGFFRDVLGYAEIDLRDAAGHLRTDRRAGHRPRARPGLLRPVRTLRRGRRGRRCTRPSACARPCCSTWPRASTTPTWC